MNFFTIPCSVIVKMRNVSNKNFRENQNTHFMWKNTAQPDRPHMTIRPTGIVC